MTKVKFTSSMRTNLLKSFCACHFKAKKHGKMYTALFFFRVSSCTIPVKQKSLIIFQHSSRYVHLSRSGANISKVWSLHQISYLQLIIGSWSFRAWHETGISCFHLPMIWNIQNGLCPVQYRNTSIVGGHNYRSTGH